MAVADRVRASAEETVAQIEQAGGRAFAIEADITSQADVARMFAEAHAGLAGLDGLVLNVGVGVGGLDLAGATPESWDQTLAVNLRGPMLCCRAGLPQLESGASIVLISSIAGLRSGSRIVAYDASKAALGGLMRHVAREASRRGIRVNIDLPRPRRHAARAHRDRGPAGSHQRRTSVRAPGDGLGDRLRGALLHLRRERLRDGADARGRLRTHGHVREASCAPRLARVRRAAASPAPRASSGACCGASDPARSRGSRRPARGTTAP